MSSHNLDSSKKGQITLTFNWIYVLIAGTIILLFFVGIVMTQKTVSEKRLSSDIVQILDSIFTGATVSEQTKNFIDISGLSGFTLDFQCEIDREFGEEGSLKDIFSSYGLKDTSARVDTPIEAIFAPREIKGKELIVWSMPYTFPFKVMDLLFVTSSNTKYFVVGGSGNPPFKQELKDTMDGLNVEFDLPLASATIGNNFHIKIVDLGNVLSEGMNLPEGLMDIDDSKISGVSIHRATKKVTFYKAKNGIFQKTRSTDIDIISMPSQERDAAQFAAIFSSDDESYRCNMMKVFKRVELVSSVHQNKKEALNDYYQTAIINPTTASTCSTILSSDDSIHRLLTDAQTCTLVGYNECFRMQEFALSLKESNGELYNSECVRIY